ncbi:unnamed protein product [Medioppia subpectinata]|uniref:Sushi domain-containing protein n=1 Tax=Medioppia subpectinata TaxID=1979941 RepID=A0A7R9KUX9_9ACAR|nr:unnamed protein product [Medioppia subpectinata]CAG2108961.1 unnamed protein product [Medioppia subpectinata]
MAAISKYIRAGSFGSLIFTIWLANSLFWIQLFGNEFLSNLANPPLRSINSIEDIGPEITYQDKYSYNIYDPEMIKKIYHGNYVFILAEAHLGIFARLHPTLAFHKSSENSMLTIMAETGQTLDRNRFGDKLIRDHFDDNDQDSSDTDFSHWIPTCYINKINTEINVWGRCGRPALPLHAVLTGIAAEQKYFNDNQTVRIECRGNGNEFPYYGQQIQCRSGQWTGPSIHCGKVYTKVYYGRILSAQLINLDIYDCSQTLVISQPIVMDVDDGDSADGHLYRQTLHRNSYHMSRVGVNTDVGADGQSCYQFRFSFNESVNIWYMFLGIAYRFEQNHTQQSWVLPTVRPYINKYRICQTLRTSATSSTTSGNSTYYLNGYYFVCDVIVADILPLDDRVDTIDVIIDTEGRVAEVSIDGLYLVQTLDTRLNPPKTDKPIQNWTSASIVLMLSVWMTLRRYTRRVSRQLSIAREALVLNSGHKYRVSVTDTFNEVYADITEYNKYNEPYSDINQELDDPVYNNLITSRSFIVKYLSILPTKQWLDNNLYSK